MSSCDKPEANLCPLGNPKPKLCVGGCGFFGIAATEDYCSLCYKKIYGKDEKLEKFFDVSSLTAKLELPTLESTAVETCTASVDLTPTPTWPPPPVPKDGCDHCNKRVKIMGYVCKCGNTFCGTHRYPEKHECGFDYKSAGRAGIAASNPLMKKDKLVDRL